eukprot:134744-Prorocentrum_minimum.AAC.2
MLRSHAGGAAAVARERAPCGPGGAPAGEKCDAAVLALAARAGAAAAQQVQQPHARRAAQPHLRGGAT